MLKRSEDRGFDRGFHERRGGPDICPVPRDENDVSMRHKLPAQRKGWSRAAGGNPPSVLLNGGSEHHVYPIIARVRRAGWKSLACCVRAIGTVLAVGRRV